MIQAPHLEGISIHSCDWSRIAAWLLDRLDSQPPVPGGDLTLYLCYHSNDLGFFASSRRNMDLVTKLLKIVEQESETDELDLGSMRFDLAPAEPPAHISLTMRDGGSGSDPAKPNEAAQPTMVEFCWQEANEQIAPGAIGLVRQWRFPLKLEDTIAAALTIESGADIARHTDRWQREVRWQQPVIYLPAGNAELSIGALAGCDLNAAALPFPLIVCYESETAEWAWSMPATPGSFQGRQRGQLVLDYPDKNGEPALSLRGAILSPPRLLVEIEADNHLPLFSLEIVGCVLPLPEPEGYGVIPEELPAALAGRVSSGLRPPGSGLLYLESKTNVPYLLLPNANPPGQRLVPKVKHHLRATGRLGASIIAYWTEPDGVLPRQFRGEMRFEPPLVSLLARGAIAGDVPDDFFIEHADSTLGRAPVRLESPNGRRYALVFNQTARHSVFVLDPHYPHTIQFDPTSTLSIPLSPDAEFIIGSIHYRLRPALDAVGNASAIESAVTPVGGVS